MKKKILAGSAILVFLLFLLGLAVYDDAPPDPAPGPADEEFLRQAREFEAEQREGANGAARRYDPGRLQQDFDQAAQSFNDTFDTQWQAHERSIK